MLTVCSLLCFGLFEVIFIGMGGNIGIDVSCLRIVRFGILDLLEDRTLWSYWTCDLLEDRALRSHHFSLTVVFV